MITDENGVRHPETIADEVALRQQAADRFFESKARRENWQRKPVDATEEGGKEQKPFDRFFARKAKREGWGQKPESGKTRLA